MKKPPPNLTKLRKEKSYVVKIKLSSIQDCNDLIQELRDQRALAKRSGGTYFVGRKNVKGEKVEFEIGFAMGECGK